MLPLSVDSTLPQSTARGAGNNRLSDIVEMVDDHFFLMKPDKTRWALVYSEQRSCRDGFLGGLGIRTHEAQGRDEVRTFDWRELRFEKSDGWVEVGVEGILRRRVVELRGQTDGGSVGKILRIQRARMPDRASPELEVVLLRGCIAWFTRHAHDQRRRRAAVLGEIADSLDVIAAACPAERSTLLAGQLGDLWATSAVLDYAGELSVRGGVGQRLHRDVTSGLAGSYGPEERSLAENGPVRLSWPTPGAARRTWLGRFGANMDGRPLHQGGRTCSWTSVLRALLCGS